MSEKQLYEALTAPFPPSEVKWRVQGKVNGGGYATIVAYVDARAVADRLDEVFGPLGWSVSHRTDNGRRLCSITASLDGVYSSKEDGSDDTQIEATKGGISDAFKRAAVQWGIARYLYRLPEYSFQMSEGYPPKNRRTVSFYDRGSKKGYWCDVPDLPAWAVPAEFTYGDESPAEKLAQKVDLMLDDQPNARPDVLPEAHGDEASAAYQAGAVERGPSWHKLNRTWRARIKDLTRRGLLDEEPDDFWRKTVQAALFKHESLADLSEEEAASGLAALNSTSHERLAEIFNNTDPIPF